MNPPAINTLLSRCSGLRAFELSPAASQQQASRRQAGSSYGLADDHALQHTALLETHYLWPSRVRRSRRKDRTRCFISSGISTAPARCANRRVFL